MATLCQIYVFGLPDWPETQSNWWGHLSMWKKDHECGPLRPINDIIYAHLPFAYVKSDVFLPNVEHSSSSLSFSSWAHFVQTSPSPHPAAPLCCREKKERKASLLSVGQCVCSIKSHHKPHGVLSSLCGSTHKDGAISCHFVLSLH